MYNINILPPKLRKTKKKIKIGNPTYAPFLLIAVIIVIFFMNNQLSNKVSIVEEEINKVKSDINKVQLGEITNLDSEIKTLREEITKINELIKGDLQWYSILDEISIVTSPEVTITSIKEGQSPDIIEIKAQTYKLQYMVKMKQSMIDNPYFTNTDISSYEYEESSIINHPSKINFTIMTSFNKQGGGQ